MRISAVAVVVAGCGGAAGCEEREGGAGPRYLRGRWQLGGGAKEAAATRFCGGHGGGDAVWAREFERRSGTSAIGPSWRWVVPVGSAWRDRQGFKKETDKGNKTKRNKNKI